MCTCEHACVWWACACVSEGRGLPGRKGSLPKHHGASRPPPPSPWGLAPGQPKQTLHSAANTAVTCLALPVPPTLTRAEQLTNLPHPHRAEQLTKALWGDWAISPKDKRVVRIKRKGAGSDSKAKPLFVQLVLEAVWKVGGV